MKMRNPFLFLVTLALWVGSAMAAPPDAQYVLGPDSKAREGVPRGQVVPMPPFHSAIYADTTRQWWLYVPAQYDPAKPACVMVFQDGGSSTGDQRQAGPWNATYVFDNLIAAGQMPVTIGRSSSAPASCRRRNPAASPVSNRSVEYDTPDGYVRPLPARRDFARGRQEVHADRQARGTRHLRVKQRRHLRVQGGLGAA